jgi:hypothetical protein
MKTRTIVVSLAALGLVLAACSSSVTNGAGSTASDSNLTVTKGDTTTVAQDVRKLWEDHITWTRLYIVSAAAGLGDTDATAKRLLANQADIGNAIKPYYGEAAGTQLTALLRQHILTAADLITAAKAGDNAQVATLKADWYANGDQIAAFLSKANPTYWPLDALKQHMKMHLDLTLDEAVAQLQGKYAAGIADYDKIHVAILELADALSKGIAGQFPDRFAAPSLAAPQAALYDAVRKLWEDHITWTRLYIVSAAAGLGDTDATAKRLLANQADIGNAIKPYYGEAAGTQLTALLRQHILTAADLITAAKAGDNAKVATLKADWYANGDQIAAFLSKANPTYWPLDALKQHMKMHLDLTLDEAVAQLQGKYAAGIADYDKIHVAILELADALSKGIAGQFPDRFV